MEISPMELQSLLTTLSLAESQSGDSSQALYYHCLTAWMAKVLNTVKAEFKDFYTFLMTTVTKSKLKLLASS